MLNKKSPVRGFKVDFGGPRRCVRCSPVELEDGGKNRWRRREVRDLDGLELRLAGTGLELRLRSRGLGHGGRGDGTLSVLDLDDVDLALGEEGEDVTLTIEGHDTADTVHELARDAVRLHAVHGTRDIGVRDVRDRPLPAAGHDTSDMPFDDGADLVPSTVDGVDDELDRPRTLGIRLMRALKTAKRCHLIALPSPLARGSNTGCRQDTLNHKKSQAEA